MRRWGLAVLLGCGGCWWESCAPADPALLEQPATETPCRELRKPVALTEETEFGRASDLLPYIEGYHSNTLMWSRGGRVLIELDAWDPRAFLVESQPAAGAVVSTHDQGCVDRLEIEVEVALNSADGRLFEEQTTLVLRAYSDVEAFGSWYIPWDWFGGTYAPPASEKRCFWGQKVKVLLGTSGFSGSLNDELSEGNCEQTEADNLFVIAGHWGSRWQSY